jgi:hypothetical protein
MPKSGKTQYRWLRHDFCTRVYEHMYVTYAKRTHILSVAKQPLMNAMTKQLDQCKAQFIKDATDMLRWEEWLRTSGGQQEAARGGL